MQDFRFALRTLRKQPVFTLAVLATLTIGLGANTAVFSIVYQVLVRPLPYPDPQRLVWVWNVYGKAGEDRFSVSIPDYLDRKTQAPAIEDATLFTPRLVAVTGNSQPEQIRALAVTPSFFTTLGRQPQLGRAFTESDAQPNADRYAILTDRFWRSHYGSNRGVLAQAVQLDGEPRQIVGVLPPDFELPQRDVAILVPFAFTPAQRSDQERGHEFSSMIARLRPGATIAEFNQQMAAIVEHTIERVPARAAFMRTSHFGGLAVPLRDWLVGDVRLSLLILQASVAVVFLIACANVANLLLMRASRRGRELAIRAALGADRRRIMRQLAVEGLVLSACGAVAGLAAGIAAARGFVLLAGDQLPVAVEPTLTLPILTLAIVLALGCGVVFGLAPAIGIMRDGAAGGLRDDGMRTIGSRRSGTVRGILVVVETALALVLLVGAGLLLKSFERVQTVNPGFSPTRVWTAQIALPGARYPNDATQRAFWDRLLLKIRDVPGVAAGGITSSIPFSGNQGGGSYEVTNRPQPPGEKPLHAQQEVVGGDYFRALQIPLIAGRVFDARDGADRPRVVIVDELLARKQFPDRSAIGASLNFGGSRNYEIIGVVGTINAADLAMPVPEERIYLPESQVPFSNMGVVVKTAADPALITAQIRAAIQAIDPEQPMADVRTMDQWMHRSLQTRRAPTTLLTLFGAAALALAAVGIYGVLAFGVNERTRELGIRQALGARPRAILALVLSEGLRTAGAGIVIGIAGSLLATRVLQSMLFQVEATDRGVLIGVSALLLFVSLCACYIPARWATRIDPMVALREP